MYLTEAFKALNALNEDTFSVTDDGIEKLAAFQQDDDLADEVKVIDPEAETEEDLQDSYVGKVILDCCVCHSKLYKDKEEVEVNEEENLANVGEECPYCYTPDGFKVIGEVVAFGGKDTETSDVEEETDETLEEAYQDTDGIMGGTKGQKYSDVELKAYWEKEKDNDPVLKNYKGDFDAWHKDTTSQMRKVNEGLFDEDNKKIDKETEQSMLGGKYQDDKWDKRLDRAKSNERKRKGHEISDNEQTLDTSKNEELSTVSRGITEGAFKGEYAGDNSTNGGKVRGIGASTQPDHKTYLGRLKNKNPELVDVLTVKGKDIKPGMMTNAGQVKKAEVRGDRVYIMHTNNYDGYWGVDEEMPVMADPDNRSEPFTGEYRDLLKMGLKESKFIKEDATKTVAGTLYKVVVEGKDEFLLTEYFDEIVSYLDNEANTVKDFDATIYTLSDFTFNNTPYLEYDGSIYQNLMFPDIDSKSVIYKDGVCKTALRAEEFKTPSKSNIENYTIRLINNIQSVGHGVIVSPANEQFKSAVKVDKVLHLFDTELEALDYAEESPRSRKIVSLTESINSLSLDTDDTHMEMTSDDTGKVTVVTQPIDSSTELESGDETIAPVSDETAEEITNNSEETLDDVEETVDASVEEFDEESFDELGESYLKEVYDNVESYKTVSVSENAGRVFVEGVIKFTSGKTKATNFILEAKDCTRSGVYRFLAENVQLTKSQKAFVITGRIHDKKFVTESLAYNYKTEQGRVRGSVRK